MAAFLALVTLGAGAQTQPQAAAPSAAATPAPAAPLAKPYAQEEFPPWVLQVRRAEILAVGAFPLAYLFAGLGYDYGYYLSHGYPQENAPWPVGPGTSQWTTAAQGRELQNKNVTLVGVALGASLLLAGVDWLLGL